MCNGLGSFLLPNIFFHPFLLMNLFFPSPHPIYISLFCSFAFSCDPLSLIRVTCMCTGGGYFIYWSLNNLPVAAPVKKITLLQGSINGQWLLREEWDLTSPSLILIYLYIYLWLFLETGSYNETQTSLKLKLLLPQLLQYSDYRHARPCLAIIIFI